jgi:MoxR-like ATPase
MQEKRVSSGGEEYKLDAPFFVLATQNPIEQEGTYPLPEAQLDRFLFNIQVKYPSYSEELDIMRSVTSDNVPVVNKVVDAKQILEFQHVVRRIPVADPIFEYAAKLVRATRPEGARRVVAAMSLKMISVRSPRRSCATASSPASRLVPRD